MNNLSAINMLKLSISATVFILLLVGCGSGGSNAVVATDANESNISKTSFLSGGVYGTLSYKVVDYDGLTALPYLSGWGINNINVQKPIPTSSNLPFTTYGGVQSSYGDSYEIYGNAALNTPVKLKYLLVPNLAITQLYKPINFKIKATVVSSQNNPSGCIAQNSDGVLTLTSDTYVCDNIPLIPSIVLTKPNQAIEVEIDLGEFSFAAVNLFELQQLLPSSFLTYATDMNTTSTTLNINSLTPSTLPQNVVAYGNFLPTPNGFGFTNFGMIDPNTLTNEDIAEMYGADAVCLNANANSCEISAYGAFLKTATTNITGGGCYGLAIASMMLNQGVEFKGKTKPSDYNPKATNAISLNHSDVARLIAYKFNNQNTPQLREYRYKTCENLTVKDTLKLIMDGFSNNDPIASLVIESANQIGHAVTPYAVSKITDDSYRIYIYDNNKPGDNTIFIEANISTNSFYYNGARNASSPPRIFSSDTKPMCPIPLSMQQYYKMNIQPQNSLQIDASAAAFAIVDAQNQEDYFNLSNKQQGIQIPNSTLTERVMASPLITIKDVATLNSLDIITSRAALEPYIKASYAMFYASGNSLDTVIYTSSLNPNYANGVTIKQTYEGNGISSMDYYIHPSSRIVMAKNPNNIMLSLFMDNNTLKKGYIYTITVSNLVPNANVSLGALIADSGELEVFVFDSTTFERLNSSINYTVTASVQDINGALPYASIGVSQAINSAIKIAMPKSFASTKVGLTRSKSVQTEPLLEIVTVY